MDSIKLMVELGQLSNKNTGQMFLHTQNADANINNVIASLKGHHGYMRMQFLFNTHFFIRKIWKQIKAIFMIMPVLVAKKKSRKVILT